MGAGDTETTPGDFLDGRVDEVAIYDRPLGGVEIMLHAFAGR
jgi:hypothetical protein